MKPRIVLCAVMTLALAGVMGVVFAEPFQDGDLFWHMAYARQMLERGTLQLDHTTFSWTPTSNQMIYCAWASELILHALWEHAGIWSLFALRYLVVAVAAGLQWDLARRLGLARQPLTYLMLLVSVLAARSGTLIKPELFSLLFMNLVVWAFFRGKLAARAGKSPAAWFYLVPVLVALWVNFHGAFILAAPFLLAVAIGEAINLRLAPANALPIRACGHLLGAWALCGAATLANPYGARYPAQLFQDYVLSHTPRPDVVWNQAYRSVFDVSAGQSGLTLVHLLVVIFLLLAGVFALHAMTAPRGARMDCALLLANLASIPLFLLYIRATPFWPPVFAGTFFYLASEEFAALPKPEAPPLARLARSLVPTFGAALAFAIIGGMAVIDARRHPSENCWLGFGIGYWNPVPEAEFLAASRLGPRLINLFDTGGYLLWRLAPRYQVMTDQRSFPYLGWFEEQYRFSNGEIFDDFLAAHPCNVAVIDLVKEPVWRQFLHAQEWQPAYYGPTAAVFLRKGTPRESVAADPAPSRFDRLRNAATAFRVFGFAKAVGDFATAWKIETQLATRLRFQIAPEDFQSVHQYREAHRALRERDYALATRLFREVQDRLPTGDRDRLILTFLDQIEKLTAEGHADATQTYRTALAKLAAPE
jgi:hypothetical protein